METVDCKSNLNENMEQVEAHLNPPKEKLIKKFEHSWLNNWTFAALRETNSCIRGYL